MKYSHIFVATTCISSASLVSAAPVQVEVRDQVHAISRGYPHISSMIRPLALGSTPSARIPNSTSSASDLAEKAPTSTTRNDLRVRNLEDTIINQAVVPEPRIQPLEVRASTDSDSEQGNVFEGGSNPWRSGQTVEPIHTGPQSRGREGGRFNNQASENEQASRTADWVSEQRQQDIQRSESPERGRSSHRMEPSSSSSPGTVPNLRNADRSAHAAGGSSDTHSHNVSRFSGRSQAQPQQIDPSPEEDPVLKVWYPGGVQGAAEAAEEIITMGGWSGTGAQFRDLLRGGRAGGSQNGTPE